MQKETKRVWKLKGLKRTHKDQNDAHGDKKNSQRHKEVKQESMMIKNKIKKPKKQNDAKGNRKTKRRLKKKKHKNIRKKITKNKMRHKKTKTIKYIEAISES